MGKFVEGWERARMAAEEREAQLRRRAEAMAAALKELSDALGEDRETLEQQNINIRFEHGALVLKRLVEPMAGVTFDPDTGHFRIHTYGSGEGSNELDAASVQECAEKLGEYAYTVKA